MAATYHHARRLYIGTTAERAAVVLDVDGIGTDYWDTDVGVLYIWDGTAWVAGFAALPHSILSATHDDTTPAVVVRGDLMTGQGVAPLWVRLAHPGALYHFQTDANDVIWLQDIIMVDEGFVGAAAALSARITFDYTPAPNEITVGDAALIMDKHNILPGGAGQDLGSAALRWDVFARNIDASLNTRTARLGVGTPAPNLDNVIATAEQAADPVFVAGVGAWLARNDAGEAKPFFVTDSGAPIEQSFELTEIVEDVTVTVGAAGDFVTIQGAVDWFKGRQILGDCIIDELDAASYDEAVVFEDILITPGSSLTLRGDQRVLAGLSYVDGSIANRAGLANGGTFNLANPCTLTVNAAGDQITVSGGTVDPDFDDGVTGVWGDGDWVLVFGNDDIIYEREVNAILGVNDNVIELKVALPGAAFPGGGGALDDGSAVCLRPDRAIDRTVAGPCIDVLGTRGLVVDGFYLEPHTGIDCHGIRAQYGCRVTLDNIAANIEDFGLYAEAQYSILDGTGGALSIWGGNRNVFINNGAAGRLWYVVSVAGTAGVRADNFALANIQHSIVTHCTDGFYARIFSMVNANSCGARQNTRGYRAALTGYTYAPLTIANNNGNITDYTPNPGGVGSAQGANFGTLYSS